MLLKVLLFCLIAYLLVCNSESSAVTLTTASQYTAAVNKSTPSIVLIGWYKCGLTMMVKPSFEKFSSQYTSIKFLEAFMDTFYPPQNLIPNLYNGVYAGTPVIAFYKNGKLVQAIDGSTKNLVSAIQTMIVKNSPVG